MNSEESSSSVSLITDVVICIVIASMGASHSPATLMPAHRHTTKASETIKHTQQKQETSVGNEGPILVGTTHTHWPGIIKFTWLY